MTNDKPKIRFRFNFRLKNIVSDKILLKMWPDRNYMYSENRVSSSKNFHHYSLIRIVCSNETVFVYHYELPVNNDQQWLILDARANYKASDAYMLILFTCLLKAADLKINKIFNLNHKSCWNTLWSNSSKTYDHLYMSL